MLTAVQLLVGRELEVPETAAQPRPNFMTSHFVRPEQPVRIRKDPTLITRLATDNRNMLARNIFQPLFRSNPAMGRKVAARFEAKIAPIQFQQNISSWTTQSRT
jgi:hypothetical protein